MVKKAFELIGKSNVCYKGETNKISTFVENQLTERITSTRSNQDKQLGFFLLALLDRATNDGAVQTIRDYWSGYEEEISDAISRRVFRYGGHRFRNAIERTHSETLDLLRRYPLKCLCREPDRLLGINGIGLKLRDWSVTNVTGNEFVVDIHIARVLLRTGIAKFHGDAWEKIRSGKENIDCNRYSVLKNAFKEKVEARNIFQEHAGFSATQYLWFFGRAVCRKIPKCGSCILRTKTVCAYSD